MRRSVLLLGALLLALLVAPSPAQAQEEIAKSVLTQLPTLNDALLAVLIFGAAFFVARISTATLDKLGERFATRRLLLKKAASLSRFILYLVATLVAVLGVFQPEASTLTAIITASAVMIGFAFKDLAGSIIAGVIILIDSPFQVGDRVQFGDVYGDVTQIGLRVVQITTLDDSVVSIPNSKFLTDVVSSANAGALDMMVQLDFFIGIEEDHLLARRLAHEAVVTSRYVFLNKPVVVLIEDVARGNTMATRVRCKFYVIDTRFELDVRSDVTTRLKLACAQHNIRTPYFIRSEQAPPPPARTLFPEVELLPIESANLPDETPVLIAATLALTAALPDPEPPPDPAEALLDSLGGADRDTLLRVLDSLRQRLDDEDDAEVAPHEHHAEGDDDSARVEARLAADFSDPAEE